MPPKDKDIRKRISDYNGSDPLEPEGTYDSINLMVYLLGNIEYDVVYGDLERFLQDLEENVDAMPSFWPQKRALKAFVTDMRAKLMGKPILLRRLFEEKLPSTDKHYFVVQEFQKLAADPSLQALCLPFLHIQSGDVPEVDSKVMDHHIKHVGKYSLYDLFYEKAKKHLTDDERTAIKNGREKGIFSRPGKKEDFQILDNRIRGGGTNHRSCNPATSKCESSESGWCNSDASGNCSAIST